MDGLQDNTLRIVLVGKSAIANTILRRREFDSKVSPHTVTKNCQRASQGWKGRNLLLMGTPGLFYTKETLQTSCEEISRRVLTSCPGLHAIILVLQLGHYMKEEQKMVALIKAIFGELAMKHIIILFTCKDNLDNETLSDCLAGLDVDLQNIIKECGNRLCVFNNSRSANKAERDAQVQTEKVVGKNRGVHFSIDANYKDIGEKLKCKEEILQIIYADQLKKEIKLIQNQYSQEEISQQEKLENALISLAQWIENRYPTGDREEGQSDRRVLVIYNPAEEQPYHCPLCGQTFLQQPSLVPHQVTHTEVCCLAAFLFHKCNEVFQSQAHLEVSAHHMGQWLFPCPACRCCFNLKQNLLTHQLIHSGEKPHQFKQCESCF
ncbi:LOW QUALITY PROTEIN: GTPase IMAP family member 7-like [Myotis myotis]|uniref:LOW QUALITY PROTEIN: GTPase IMAP family member 7-like n=1 Tax=Myotis myotis TaxID=51298 RepID=UPI00174A1556|nr:LOW QUALITY PROTEIN: GTPase IMAP family member 7-like [Myotis myotis]